MYRSDFVRYECDIYAVDYNFLGIHSMLPNNVKTKLCWACVGFDTKKSVQSIFFN